MPPPPGYLQQWRATRNTCLVTGATDGIGRALAIRLADAGQNVAVVGRSAQKVKRVLNEINDVGPTQSHQGFVADLSLISEVDRLADTLRRDLPEMNRIALCASETPGFHGITPEGIEAGFAVNYLSRFRLLNELAPLIKQQQEPRVVSFASPSIRFVPPNMIALNDPESKLSKWDRRKAHTICNLLFLKEFAERMKGTGARINAFGPGLVLTKQVAHYSLARRFWLGILSSLIGKTAAYAALPAMYMLLSQSFSDGTAGFYEGHTKITADNQLWNKARQQWFWEETSQLVQLAQARQ
ncbi:putative oxidoreductase YghA [Pseudovibrio axinellae]|uniref:Putative oxidoreductase YghA n=1 Tax=Pseudovibrio axinellae TaxID=989403 RepID=A0A165YUH2_9HYPH|nr:SDR family NAD(P)-dependent oxidoreductase [Pseudovibrio axinellae]KZL19247.1 putative oxidoreductase YghA [Pseudovibrio axinellae]SEQ44338.1 NAD(P)-dependent dehydrogenase, short-chain alcohol dehydrogenase family [Pseudovibrio axinellae]